VCVRRRAQKLKHNEVLKPTTIKLEHHLNSKLRPAMKVEHVGRGRSFS